MRTDLQDQFSSSVGPATVLGRLVGTTPDGVPLVDYPGNEGDPAPARSTVTILTDEVVSLPEVVLTFPAGPDPTPVIVGVIQNHPIMPIPNIGRLEPRSPIEVSTDGRQLILCAYSELHLVCGESSITLRRDGKVIVRGTHLLSRASVTNRIQGGSVHIN